MLYVTEWTVSNVGPGTEHFLNKYVKFKNLNIYSSMPCELLFAQGDDLDSVLPSRKLPLGPLAPPLHLPKYVFPTWIPECQSQRGPEAIWSHQLVRSREGQGVA